MVLIGYEPVPRHWFPASIKGTALLCLASGGGQQGPVLAAAGADVTVFDTSPRQLGRDEGALKLPGCQRRDVVVTHRPPVSRGLPARAITASSFRRKAAGQCVEVGAAALLIAVRDSKDPDGARLAFGREAWEAFAAKAKADIN